MRANQASSTPPTTAASSDQMMPDGVGMLSTFLGQSQGLQMAWRRLPVYRSDIERRFARCVNKRRLNHECNQKLENDWRLGVARLDRRDDDSGWIGEGLWTLSAGPG